MSEFTQKLPDIAPLRRVIYWKDGVGPKQVEAGMQNILADKLPEMLNEVLNAVAEKAKLKLQSIHKSRFNSKSSGISFQSIIKLDHLTSIQLIPGLSSRVHIFHVGYYPNYIPKARQFFVKHKVENYMGYMNVGVEPGKIRATRPGISGSVGGMGLERLREWTRLIGIAQGNRPYTRKILRTRKHKDEAGNLILTRTGGKEGRPSKFITYRSTSNIQTRETTYLAGPNRQLWMIVKHMEKHGIKKRSQLYDFGIYIRGNELRAQMEQSIEDVSKKLDRVCKRKNIEMHSSNREEANLFLPAMRAK